MIDPALAARLAAVALIVVLTGWVLRALTRAGLGSDFAVRRGRDGTVTVRGRVPRSKCGALRDFVARDLGGAGAVAIFGRYGPGRSVRLRFAGRLSPGERQRARNVLVELLR